jgi:hypothetical protein
MFGLAIIRPDKNFNREFIFVKFMPPTGYLPVKLYSENSKTNSTGEKKSGTANQMLSRIFN